MKKRKQLNDEKEDFKHTHTRENNLKVYTQTPKFSIFRFNYLFSISLARPWSQDISQFPTRPDGG